jgi:hypothetical protein
MRLAVALPMLVALGCARSPEPVVIPILARDVGDFCHASPCGTRLYDSDGGFIVQSCRRAIVTGGFVEEPLPIDEIRATLAKP